jgi:sodium-dependent phosphate cotransporter
MRVAMQSRVEAFLDRFLNRSAFLSILVGIVVTVMVQSSSITTSLLVPLAGAGLITLQQAFPITLGANIGTTVTALMASMAVSGVNAQAGVTIALVHLLFNVTGTVMIYPVKAIRRIPLRLAQGLADIAVNSRQWALLYVLVLFYGLPAFFAFADRLFR